MDGVFIIVKCHFPPATLPTLINTWKNIPWEPTINWAEFFQKLKSFASSSCLPFHKMGFLLCVINGIGWGNANWLIKSLFDEVIGKGPAFLLNGGGGLWFLLTTLLWMILIELQLPQAANWDLLKNVSSYRIKIRWEF